MTRMQRGCAPFMSSSRAQSSGTSPNPAARAAVAGNIEWMSSVAVNSTEMTRRWSTSLRAIIAAKQGLRALGHLLGRVFVNRRRSPQGSHAVPGAVEWGWKALFSMEPG